MYCPVSFCQRYDPRYVVWRERILTVFDWRVESSKSPSLFLLLLGIYFVCVKFTFTEVKWRITSRKLRCLLFHLAWIKTTAEDTEFWSRGLFLHYGSQHRYSSLCLWTFRSLGHNGASARVFHKLQPFAFFSLCFLPRWALVLLSIILVVLPLVFLWSALTSVSLRWLFQRCFFFWREGGLVMSWRSVI